MNYVRESLSETSKTFLSDNLTTLLTESNYLLEAADPDRTDRLQKAQKKNTDRQPGMNLETIVENFFDVQKYLDFAFKYVIMQSDVGFEDLVGVTLAVLGF